MTDRSRHQGSGSAAQRGVARRLAVVVGGVAVLVALLLALPGTATAASLFRVVDQEHLDGFCRSQGAGGATLVAPNAYGWQCTGGAGVDMDALCRGWVGEGIPQISRLTDFNNPYQGWECWNTTPRRVELSEQADISAHCQAKGYAGATLVDSTAYGWRCAGPSGTALVSSMRELCTARYGAVGWIDRVQNYYDPYSWQCHQ